MGVSDNNTTGRFMNQQFEILDTPLGVATIHPAGQKPKEAKELR
jgi:hypothetical protein